MGSFQGSIWTLQGDGLRDFYAYFQGSSKIRVKQKSLGVQGVRAVYHKVSTSFARALYMRVLDKGSIRCPYKDVRTCASRFRL